VAEIRCAGGAWRYDAGTCEGRTVGDSLPVDQREDEAKRRPRRRLTIDVEWSTIWKVIVAVLATIAGLWMLDRASHLIGMVAFSFFLSLALQPLVLRLVHRFGWRRGSAVGVIYLGGLVALVLLIWVLVPAIVTLADAIGTNASAWVQSGIDWVQSTFDVTISEGGLDPGTSAEFGAALADWATGAVGSVLGIATTGIGLVFDLATIAMFTFYFTADAPRFQRTVLGLLSPKEQYRVGWTWDQAIVQTGGYFYSRVLLMIINGTGFFFTMVVVGMPVGLSIPLAVFAGFVAAFIPAIGTYLGSAVPIIMTLAIQGWLGALVVLAYALIYQQIENYWLSPKISSNTMSLNGAVAFGAALAGGAIFGPIGAFVALPVAALITAFVSNFAPHNEVVYDFEYDNHAETPPDG
jgi:predicted PurR-regulated permease PerM